MSFEYDTEIEQEALRKAGIGEKYLYADIEKCRVKDKIRMWFDNFTYNYNTGKGVLLTGPVGTGKTSTLVLMAIGIIRCKGYRFSGRGEDRQVAGASLKGIFTSSNAIFSAIFRKKYEFIDNCKKVGSLFIDDFGREYYHDFPFSEFEEIIEYRYANQKPTFVSTNLTRETLTENENFQRVVDRWRECCYVWQIGGDSMRKKS